MSMAERPDLFADDPINVVIAVASPLVPAVVCIIVPPPIMPPPMPPMVMDVLPILPFMMPSDASNPKTKNHYTVHRLELYWKEHTKLPCTHYEGTRHSFCAQISEIDDKKAVQDLMRHVDNRSTDRYIHSRTEYLRDA
jgi:hypothetical protein